MKNLAIITVAASDARLSSRKDRYCEELSYVMESFVAATASGTVSMTVRGTLEGYRACYENSVYSWSENHAILFC